MKDIDRQEARKPPLFLPLAILLLWLLAAWPVRAEETFLAPEKAFQLSVGEQVGAKVRLHWALAPGYYLYRDRMAITREDGVPVKVSWPAGERKVDPNFGTVQVYHREVSVDVDAGTAGALQLTWQGCAEQGVCYPPQKKTIALRPAAGGAS
jgi:thiol:disulfide interchange protein DsbD